jgi:hypothetical protein
VQSVRGIASLKPHINIEDPFPDAYDENPHLVEHDIESKYTPLPFEIESIRRAPMLVEGPDDRVRRKKSSK